MTERYQQPQESCGYRWQREYERKGLLMDLNDLLILVILILSRLSL